MRSLQELKDIVRNKITDALLPYSVDHKTQGELFDNILSIISTILEQNGGDIFNGYIYTSSAGPTEDLTGNLSYISSQTASGSYVYANYGNLTVTVAASEAPAMIFITRVNGVWSWKVVPLSMDLEYLATKEDMVQIEQKVKEFYLKEKHSISVTQNFNLVDCYVKQEDTVYIKIKAVSSTNFNLLGVTSAGAEIILQSNIRLNEEIKITAPADIVSWGLYTLHRDSVTIEIYTEQYAEITKNKLKINLLESKMIDIVRTDSLSGATENYALFDFAYPANMAIRFSAIASRLVNVLATYEDGTKGIIAQGVNQYTRTVIPAKNIKSLGYYVGGGTDITLSIKGSLTTEIEENKLSGRLYKKKYTALGDSITIGDGATDGKGSWFDRLCARLNSTAANYAYSGNKLRLMANEMTPELLADCYKCFIAGGTNREPHFSIGTINDLATPDLISADKNYDIGDYVLGGLFYETGNIQYHEGIFVCTTGGNTGSITLTEIATMTETVNALSTMGTAVFKFVKYATLYGDLWRILERTQGFNPKMELVWILPIRNRGDVGKSPEDWTRGDIRQPIKDFCLRNGIKVVDMGAEFPLNKTNTEILLKDHLHPTNDGYEIMADIVQRSI